MRNVASSLAGAALSVFLIAPAIAPAETLGSLTSVQIVGNVPFENQLRSAQALGVRRVRLAVRWYEVERPKGRFTWRPSDDRVRAVLRAGMTPILVLHGANGGYRGAGDRPGGPPSSGEALDGFARFAAATVQRYGAGSAAMPILYEIWNEPNTKTFWRDPPDPEGYARMATAACEAIRAASPHAKVIALGMEGTPVKPPYFVSAYNIDIYQQWANRAATPALMACADGISMHPYFGIPEMHHRYEPDLQRYVAAHWSKQVPPIIANTEWGYAIDARRGRTAQDQAALDIRALLIGTATGRVTNLYQSVDGGRDNSKPDQTFGLVTAFGQIKPAGIALRRLLQTIGDYEIEGLEHTPGQPSIYRFKARRGSARAEILWTINVPASAPIAAGGQAIDLVTGAARPIANGRIAIGPSPVLVSWSG